MFSWLYSAILSLFLPKFALALANIPCAHSSMDRILDSGSNDWGSTPHGRTQKTVLHIVGAPIFRKSSCPFQPQIRDTAAEHSHADSPDFAQASQIVPKILCQSVFATVHLLDLCEIKHTRQIRVKCASFGAIITFCTLLGSFDFVLYVKFIIFTENFDYTHENICIRFNRTVFSI